MPLTRAEAVDASFPQASDFRKHRAGVFPREGIYPDPTTTAVAGVAYAGSGWAVGARAFVAEVKRGGAPYSQAYGSATVSNDSNVASAWTIGAAPASGARIDLLCIRVRDVTQSDSTSGAPTDGPSGAARTGFPEFLVVAGTAGTTPARPALPAGYMEIAQIQTPAGAASTAGSTITQTYAFAQVVGGAIYVRSIAERNALTNVLPGDRVVMVGSGISWDKTSTGWAGSSIRAAYVATTTDSSGFVTVPHPFGEAPAVVVAPGYVNGLADASTRLFEPVLWDRTDTDFTVRFIRRDTNAWVDVQAVRFNYTATSPST